MHPDTASTCIPISHPDSLQCGAAGDNPSPVLRLVAGVTLPKHAREVPGLLYALTRDENGNLYFSDEVNHNLTSLDEFGRLRWRVGGKGTAAGEFHYPRGVALGWILQNGAVRRALCVCDAWNHRVQMFDPDGRHLCSWASAGGLKFSQVCDARYIEGLRREESYWLLLDGGNHRLCALGLDGNLLFQIGRAVAPGLQAQWFKAGLEPPDDPAPDGIGHDYAPFDPLYYPTRILGSEETALYLYEAISGSLKQPFLGNLFPLSIRQLCGAEWIAADAEGYLAWSASGNRLSWFDVAGNLVCDRPVQGRPVASNLPTDSIWLHVGDQLQLWQLDRRIPPQTSRTRTGSFEALWRAALDELAVTVPDPSETAFKDLLAATDVFLHHCDELLAQVTRPQAALGDLQKNQEGALSALKTLTGSCYLTIKSVHPLYLAALKLRLLSQSSDGNASGARLNAARELLGRRTRAVEAAAARTLTCLDKTIYQRLCPHASSRDLAKKLDSLLEEQANGLICALSNLQRWSGAVFNSERLMVLPSSKGRTVSDAARDNLPGEWLRRPTTRLHRASSRCLRERDPIFITAAGSQGNRNPCCVTRDSNGQFYVAFPESGSLLHLDAAGRIIDVVFGSGCKAGTLSGPTGLAVDGRNRLWIVEHTAHRVRIFDPDTAGPQTIGGAAGGGPALRFPAGICVGAEGSMLVADQGNDRVALISAEGLVSPLAGRSGTGPGEFRYPVSLCADASDPDGAIWVVDQRNHRLQNIDGSGRFLREIRGCGCGPGTLVFPQQIARFADGTLAVSQSSIDRSIKLFSPEGSELDRLFLDYFPGGMCVSDDLLLVTEAIGDSIRIYQKT